MKRLILISILALGSIGVLFSEAPVRTEELIYTIVTYNGKDYSATFCREDSDTIYVHANGDAFLSVKKNFVYYWPITQEWKIDDSVLDITFEGTVEIRGNGIEQRLKPVDYTYFNLRGEYESNWKAVEGEEAHAEWDRYLALVKDYIDAVQTYNKEKAAYETRINELFLEISALKQAGKDQTKKLAELNACTPPPEPKEPEYYLVPPVQIQRGYHVNLPEGEYTIRFLTQDGKVMSGSRKKLVVFDKRRTATIGFDVIPEDRWTMPSESNKPSSVLYVNGKTDLFIRPYIQNEYNDLYFNKLVMNDARGNPNLYRWVKIQQVPKCTVELFTGKERAVLKEAPYVVEQVEGENLGYRIVNFEPEGAHKGKSPSIIAFRIPIREGNTKSYSFTVIDEHGTKLKGSERAIRIISGHRAVPLSIFLTAVPLFVMGCILVVRRRRLAEKPRAEIQKEV
ncbi:MAG TPA: hypothetical protein PLG43_09730 [Spirochaetia bacterium]|nr:hypothetical protein [Spirochaetia bacterium]